MTIQDQAASDRISKAEQHDLGVGVWWMIRQDREAAKNTNPAADHLAEIIAERTRQYIEDMDEGAAHEPADLVERWEFRAAWRERTVATLRAWRRGGYIGDVDFAARMAEMAAVMQRPV